MIGCSAIILTGIAYNEKYFLDYGFDLLKKIIKVSFDKDGFPKTRNLRQLNFYLKYFILIREWLKESQNEISDYLDEIIYYLGQAFTLTNKNISNNFLFNGNHNFKDTNLEIQIKKLGYNFKNDLDEVGGYLLLKNKNFVLAADLGPHLKEIILKITNLVRYHLSLLAIKIKLLQTPVTFKIQNTNLI